ncbi:lipase family protein [Nocardioides ultimimeridianus]
MNLRASLATISVALVAATLAPAPTHAAPAPAPRTSPLSSPFYNYSGSTPLRDLKPGTVLKTRTVPYSIQGLALPLQATQILYRTRNQVGRAVVNVTTVVKPVVPVSPTPKVLSYQSFYDSLNPADEPSAAIAGASGLGAGNANVETLVFAPALLAGYTINIPDTEGQKADFAAGPEYGYTTLDSLRAISHSAATGVGGSSKIGLIGYSGGAIASEWAAELAPTYSPGVASRIVGTAIGGVLVHPGHNLHYVQGSLVWAGVMPMALVGLARAFHLDLAQYANAYGRSVMTKMQKAPISAVLGMYPGLTWKRIAKARYAQPEQLPVFVRTANKLIMGRFHTPTAPMFIGQGTGGGLEGTSPSKVYGSGDGVMIAGDVRSLAREYCSRGVTVKYTQYSLSHFTSVAQWLPAAYSWMMGRFAGTAAPSSCGSIAKGNSLAPLKLQS